jgi:nucleoid-associated protein YgaU
MCVHYQGVKMKLVPWLLLMGLSLVGCSGSKSAQNVNSETPQIELSDADEFIENPNEESASLESTPAEDPSADSSVVAEAPAESLEEPASTTESVSALTEDSTQSLEGAAPVISNDTSSMGGSEKTYTVQKNETLMLIAFKLYGNYERWKELANYNQGALNGSTNLKEGMVLKYNAPAEEFVWNPAGLPYLIRTGDTLGKISGSVYNDQKKWKLIWNNNKPLIKDPNKIFSGFTIYYLENGREVAAEL